MSAGVSRSTSRPPRSDSAVPSRPTRRQTPLGRCVRSGQYGPRGAPHRRPLRCPLHRPAHGRPAGVDARRDAEIRRVGARPRGHRRVQTAELDDSADGDRAGRRSARAPRGAQAGGQGGGPARDPRVRGPERRVARDGRGRSAREGRRRAPPPGGARGAAGCARGRDSARSPGVADGHRPRRPHVPRRRRGLARSRGEAHGDDRGGRAALPLPGANPARPGDRRLPRPPGRRAVPPAGSHACGSARDSLRRGRPRAAAGREPELTLFAP